MARREALLNEHVDDRLTIAERHLHTHHQTYFFEEARFDQQKAQRSAALRTNLHVADLLQALFEADAAFLHFFQRFYSFIARNDTLTNYPLRAQNGNQELLGNHPLKRK